MPSMPLEVNRRVTRNAEQKWILDSLIGMDGWKEMSVAMDGDRYLTRGVAVLSPERRRIAANHAQQKHRMTERRACRLANQPRGTQRYRAIRREDEDALTQSIIQLASQ